MHQHRINPWKRRTKWTLEYMREYKRRWNHVNRPAAPPLDKADILAILLKLAGVKGV